jgi:phospholipid/cholesterol/gamma-HCH transport system substrate-binding protein
MSSSQLQQQGVQSAYKLNFMVGLFFIASLLALLFIALRVSHINYNSNQTYNISARFDNIGALKNGATVKSSGVVIGKVSDIIFNDKIFQAQVNIELMKKYQFPKDSQLKIATSGLLGDQYISIDAGSETAMLANGDQIEQTQSAMVLEDLIGKMLYSKAQDMGKGNAGVKNKE